MAAKLLPLDLAAIPLGQQPDELFEPATVRKLPTAEGMIFQQRETEMLLTSNNFDAVRNEGVRWKGRTGNT